LLIPPFSLSAANYFKKAIWRFDLIPFGPLLLIIFAGSSGTGSLKTRGRPLFLLSGSWEVWTWQGATRDFLAGLWITNKGWHALLALFASPFGLPSVWLLENRAPVVVLFSNNSVSALSVMCVIEIYSGPFLFVIFSIF
jgi:hypothetical protein